jgi:hypothetical protein
MTGRRVLLHESTQRGLCRVGFLLLGAAPLLLCLYLAIATFIPGYGQRQAATWEERLEKTFGLKFQIGKAQMLAPYRMRFDNVQILQPESKKLVAQVQSIELALGPSDSWNIRLTSPQVQLDQFSYAVRTLNHWYLSRPSSSLQRAVIQSDGLTLMDSADAADLSAVTIKVLPDGKRWRLDASFAIPPAHPHRTRSAAVSPECRFIVERKSSKDSIATDMQLRLPSPIPCGVLAKLFEPRIASIQNSNLGLVSSQFSGNIDVRSTDQKVDYYVVDSTISNIDMGRVTAGSESILSGIGRLNITRAKLNSTQLELVEGTMEFGPGRIDASFLQSLRFSLGIRVPLQYSVSSIGFDRMAVSFRIQPNSIEFIGAGNEGALIEDSLGAVALRTDPSKLPLISLVDALAYKRENPTTPRFSPLVRTALLWLPLEDQQRQQLASGTQGWR